MDEKNIIRVTPDDLGYKDRGKMKWQGLILSDQTEMMKQQEKDDKAKYPDAKPLMNIIDVAQILQQAYLHQKPIAIQANILRNGHFYPDVKCMVQGVGDGKIYLKLKDGRLRSCRVEDIRNVQFMDPLEWYQKK